MINFNNVSQLSQRALQVTIQWIDDVGNFIDPRQLREVDYLYNFPHKSVINKVYADMLAEQRSGTIQVYRDRIEVKEA